jgi:hypothetical protein
MTRELRTAFLARTQAEALPVNLSEFQPSTGYDDEARTNNLDTAFQIIARLNILIPAGNAATLMDPAARTAAMKTATSRKATSLRNVLCKHRKPTQTDYRKTEDVISVLTHAQLGRNSSWKWKDPFRAHTLQEGVFKFKSLNSNMRVSRMGTARAEKSPRLRGVFGIGT